MLISREEVQWKYWKSLKEKGNLIYTFVHWVLPLPEELEMVYHDEIERFEKEELKMGQPYITTAERIGIKKGKEMGEQKGEKNIFIHLLKLKFKEIPLHYLQEIEKAEKDTLHLWAGRILNAESLDEVFLNT